MEPRTESLHAAHKALQRRDWPRALRAFEAAEDGEHPLGPDDLAAYSDAAWWLGRNDDALSLSKAAYRGFLADARAMEAAEAALDVAVIHFLRGDEPVAVGWVGRAAHLAHEVPEGPLHGYLLYLTEVEAGLGSPDPTAAIEAARQVQRFGERFDDPGLLAAGLNGEGRGLLRVSRVAEGIARLDESMVTVLEGRLTPELAGNLYCNTIAACYEVGDVSRMARWTELAMQWVGSLPAAVLFGGICRVHQTQLLVLRGEWGRAESEALQVTADLASISVANVAEAWYVVGECRRLRGSNAGAASAYGEAHVRGRDPQPGHALLRLQVGDVHGAITTIRTALAAADPWKRPAMNAALVEIGLAAGRVDEARIAAQELTQTAETLRTSGLTAMATSARGAVVLAAGEADDALGVLRDACRQWYELGAGYDAARVCVLLARAYAALDDKTSAGAEFERAEDVFTRLGAAPALAGLTELRGDRPTPGGLTGRELEVLRLVAAGWSNLRIAEELFISDRTVARHLSNIFRKLGVASRTQAARFALDAGLVRSAR
jgi:DNA-binding CsgD family transcriptional regulator